MSEINEIDEIQTPQEIAGFLFADIESYFSMFCVISPKLNLIATKRKNMRLRKNNRFNKQAMIERLLSASSCCLAVLRRSIVPIGNGNDSDQLRPGKVYV